MQELDDINRLRVLIHGAEYMLRGRDSIAHLRQVADKVNQMMDEVSSRAPNLDERRVAVLTALNLADELCKLQEEHQDLLELLEDKTSVDVKE
jgi:cell division protein ZapA